MLKNILISSLLIIFTSQVIFPTYSFSEDKKNLDSKQELFTDEHFFSKEIAEAQWKTVEKLQTLIKEKNYDQIPMCFSKGKFRDRVIKSLNEIPDWWISVWELDEFRLAKYKKQVFSGNGIFVFEDGEWKINEL